MNEMNFEIARFNMAEQQIRPWNILDSKCLDELQNVPREEFVPENYKKIAFSDTELPLEHGQYMLSPKIEAQILQAVQIKKSDSVLEIGTGTGFLTAVLAHLAKQVHSVDIYPDFTEGAQSKLKSLELNNVSFETSDASSGLSKDEKFDVIILSAAFPEIPEYYQQLLNIDGRLFVVSGSFPVMSAHIITRVSEHHYADVVMFETELPFMVNADKSPVFDF